MNVHYLKYVIGHLLSPWSLLFFVLLFSYLAIVFGRKVRLAKTLLGLALVTLYGLSTNYGADFILAPLEFKYANFEQAKFALKNNQLNYIVVLSCTHNQTPHLPESSKLLGCSQIRLHEALRLYQANPGSKVIVTGAGFGNLPTLAQQMALFALRIGIKPQDLIKEERAFNTEEEVAYISTQIVDSQAALVTSAAHMPRAMHLFNLQGLTLIPAPTDYLIRDIITAPHLRYFIPEVANLQKVNVAAHEYYGQWWLALKQIFE